MIIYVDVFYSTSILFVEIYFYYLNVLIMCDDNSHDKKIVIYVIDKV